MNNFPERDSDGYMQTADAVVLAGSGESLSLLVIKRKNDPYKEEYAFPGGFLDTNEEPLDACKRELMEEACLDLSSATSIALTVRQKSGRDPRGLTRTYPFLFLVPNVVDVCGADDALEAVWIPLIKLDRLAFDHGAILCEALSLFWTELPRYNRRTAGVKLPKIFSSKDTKIPFCFYGGSFNPWHDGHLECVLQASKLTRSGITIIPDSNPLKELASNECFWLKYAALASKFSDSPHAVFSGYLGMECSNPTSNWISALEQKSRFIIGDDNLKIIRKWIDYRKLILSLTELIVIPRELSIHDSQLLIEDLQAEFPELKVTLLNSHKYQDLSSTRMRS